MSIAKRVLGSQMMSSMDLMDFDPRMLQNESLDLEAILAVNCSSSIEDEGCDVSIGNAALLALLSSEFPVIEPGNSDSIWLLVAGFLVFFMHAGFSMLEAGSVRRPNVVNIMFKNIGTVCIGAILYWLMGWAFAYGELSGDDGEFSGTFIGYGAFGYDFDSTGGDDLSALFFFQYTFAATAATIVSGAVAERISLGAYFIAAAVITGFTFPVVTHWVWSGEGFMSAFAPKGDLIGGSIGLIDFAGSGVVHATGGFIALVAAFIVGPRKGRFVDGVPQTLEPSSYTLQTLGTFILWFGWYGFNAGSTLVFDGTNSAKAALTTTLSASAAGVVGTIWGKLVKGHYDLPLLCNSILGGLVSITAGCTAVDDWAALLIGVIGAFVYIGSSWLIERFGIDDPIGASPVHGFCGIWGVLAVGIFYSQSAVDDSYGAEAERGAQFGMQAVGIIIIVLWAVLWGVLIFLPMKLLGFLRISDETEDAGLDTSEHGGAQVVHM